MKNYNFEVPIKLRLRNLSLKRLIFSVLKKKVFNRDLF